MELAIHHPQRVKKLFAFAANTDPSGLLDSSKSSVFNAFITRAQDEYKKLSPTPDGYEEFFSQITKMWLTQLAITAE